MALSFADQMRRDYAAALPVITDVLVEQYGVAPGERVRIDDIASALGRAAPNIVSDCAMALAIDQHQAAHDLIVSGLQALREVDRFVFDPVPDARRYTLLKIRVLGLTDLPSALENTRLTGRDDLRRGWAHFCRLAESKGIAIPSEADAHFLPHPEHHAAGGVNATRNSGWQRAPRPVDGKFE